MLSLFHPKIMVNLLVPLRIDDDFILQQALPYGMKKTAMTDTTKAQTYENEQIEECNIITMVDSR